MHRWLRTCSVACLTLFAATWSLAGCRRHEPPPLVARNLGTAERPLLPAVAPAVDQDILEGRATPVRLDEIPEEEFLAAAAPGETDAALPGQDVPAGDRDAINELIELTVQAGIDGNYSELSEYFVPDQREGVVTLAEIIGRVGKSASALNEVLKEKAPQMVEQMQQMAAAGGAAPGLPPGLSSLAGGDGEPDVQAIATLITPSAMRMMDPETIAGSIGPEGQTLPVEFKLIDKEWYFRLPPALVDAELVAGLVRIGGLIDVKVVDITGRLSDGSLAPEQLMPEIMTALPEIQAAALELKPAFERAVAEIRGGATADIPEGEPVSDEDKALLTELVAIFTEAVGERRFADLVDLVVPEQQPIAEKVYPAVGRLLIALDKLAEALEDASAGGGDAVKPLIDSITPVLGLDGLRMVASGKIVALVTRAGTQTPQAYEYVNDNWFYRDSTLPADDAAADSMVQALDGAAGKIDTLAEAETAPADVAAELGSILAGLQPVPPAADGAGPPEGEAAEDGATPDDEADADSEPSEDEAAEDDADAGADDEPGEPPAPARPGAAGRSVR